VKKLFLAVTTTLSFLMVSVAAQEAVERVGCDPADPKNNCPGEDCDCVDDTLEVVFDSAESTNSIFSYGEFVPGMELQTRQIGNIVSEGIQGWSLGVAHDGEALDLVDVTYLGWPAEGAQRHGLNILAFEDIQSCESGALDCQNVTLSSFGYIHVVALAFKKNIFLDTGVRHLFTTATYSLKEDVGEDGTLIQVKSTLGQGGSSPVRRPRHDRGSGEKP
jgi:hypothetical protein